MKRRSATSSPPEPVFFTDENLGRHKLPEALRRGGLRVEIHGDHFPQGTPDEDWLPVVAARGWVLLTLDAKLRYNRLERDAILAHRLAAFLLVGGRTHEEKADAFRPLRHQSEKPPPALLYRVPGRIALLRREARRDPGRPPPRWWEKATARRVARRRRSPRLFPRRSSATTGFCSTAASVRVG